MGDSMRKYLRLDMIDYNLTFSNIPVNIQDENKFSNIEEVDGQPGQRLSTTLEMYGELGMD